MKEETKVIVDMYAELPIEAQKSVGWLLANWELIKALMEGGNFSEDFCSKLMKSAEERDDYAAIALLTYRMFLDGKPSC